MVVLQQAASQRIHYLSIYKICQCCNSHYLFIPYHIIDISKAMINNVATK